VLTVFLAGSSPGRRAASVETHAGSSHGVKSGRLSLAGRSRQWCGFLLNLIAYNYILSDKNLPYYVHQIAA
jgi:hypothetical protein